MNQWVRSLPRKTVSSRWGTADAEIEVRSVESPGWWNGCGQPGLGQNTVVPALPSPRAHLPSRGGDVAVYVQDINQPSLPTIFHSVLVSTFFLYGPFNCISLHKSSQQFSAFSLCSSRLISALWVLSTIYLFMKVSLSPDIIFCGWLGLKHQLTN